MLILLRLCYMSIELQRSSINPRGGKRNLTPLERRATQWKAALGYGGLTQVAGRTQYSVQYVSQIVAGQRFNPIMLAYIAGLVDVPWEDVSSLISPELPADVWAWWGEHGQRAWETGCRGGQLEGRRLHNEWLRVTRQAMQRMTGDPQRGPAVPKRAHPPVAAGGPRRRVRSSSDHTHPGNGPRVRAAEQPTVSPGRSVGGRGRPEDHPA
jgi:hypothetical protein